MSIFHLVHAISHCCGNFGNNISQHIVQSGTFLLFSCSILMTVSSSISESQTPTFPRPIQTGEQDRINQDSLDALVLPGILIGKELPEQKQTVSEIYDPLRNIPKVSLYLGISAYMKFCYNEKVPENRITDFDLLRGMDGMITTFVPFERRARYGAGLNFGYSNYRLVNKPKFGAVQSILPTNDNRLYENYNFLVLYPHFKYYGYEVGLAYGFAGTAYVKNWNKEGTSVLYDQPTYTGNYSPYLGTIQELRFGLNYTADESDWYLINISFKGTYMLGGLYADASDYAHSRYIAQNGISDESNKINPSPFSLMLGIQWMYKLTITR